MSELISKEHSNCSKIKTKKALPKARNLKNTQNHNNVAGGLGTLSGAGCYTLTCPPGRPL